MRHFFVSFATLFVCLALAACGDIRTNPSVQSSAQTGYDYRHDGANRLSQILGQSLQQLRSRQRPEKLREALQLFASIDRRALSGESLIELKYMMAAFRDSVVQARLGQLGRAGVQDKREIIEDLDLIGGYLSDRQSDELVAATVGNPELRAAALRLLAKFGEPRRVRARIQAEGNAETKRLAGPEQLLAYVGPDATPQENAGWLDMPGQDLESYRATGPFSAIIRGVEVRSGDIFFLDQGMTAGVNTNFSLPRSFASHVGLVVFIERGGKTYPAFFEIATKGLRVVPLNAAFVPPFNVQGEVYRLKGQPTDPWVRDYEGWARRLSADVQRQVPLRYDYDYSVPRIVTGNERGLVCSTQVQAFLLRAGVRLNLPADRVDPRASRTLQREFRYNLTEYVTPTSFFRPSSTELQFVGAIGSNLIAQNIARELVIGTAGEAAPGSMGYLFSHYDLSVARINPPALRAQYENLRRFLVPTALFTSHVHVRAPHAVLAFARILDTPLNAAIRERMADFHNIYRFDSTEPFSLAQKAMSPEFRQALDRSMAPLRSWFNP